MKRELLPYYISRAIISAGLGIFVVLNGGWSWWAGTAMGILGFVVFLWYAHSGYYLLDLSTPLFPLRRDARSIAIRNQALVVAVGVGGVSYALLSLLKIVVPLPSNLGTWVFSLGVVVYFVATNWLFARGTNDADTGDI